MQAVEKFGPAVGRILLAFFFLASGIDKILDWDRTVGLLRFVGYVGMPMVPLFLIGAIVFELAGSVSVMVGFKARWGALALVVVTIPTTLFFLTSWAYDLAHQRDQMIVLDQQLDIIMFMKNLAMIGGLLLIMAHGAGPLSLDDKSGGR